MSLPRDVARCAGRKCDTPQGLMTEPACVNCVRRIEGVADYMAGVRAAWMEPPSDRPCPERLLTKQEARNA